MTRANPVDPACTIAPAPGEGLRRIIYASRSADPWPETALSDLASGSGLRNAARGITGRLVHVEGAFLQAIEGPDAEVERLYRRIQDDRRHTQVTLLDARGIDGRAFLDWSFEQISADGLAPLAADAFGGADSANIRIEDLMAGVSRPFAAATMRAVPVQPRALKTVERIVAAGRRVGLDLGGRPPTLQAVADTAGVGLGAVYRYFSTPDDLIRMLVRLSVLARYNRYRARLRTIAFGSVDELVDHMVDNAVQVVRNDLHEPGVSRRVKTLLMRDYHRIPYEELRTLAGDVLQVARRDALGLDGPDIDRRLGMAFAAAAGLLNMYYLHGLPARDEAHFRAALRALFLGALTGDRGPAEPDPAAA
jgi:AcrR family transcriptional regulator